MSKTCTRPTTYFVDARRVLRSCIRDNEGRHATAGLGARRP